MLIIESQASTMAAFIAPGVFTMQENLRSVVRFLIPVVLAAPLHPAVCQAAPHEPSALGASVVNILDHGAMANDGKDDTAAVTAAIEACQRGDVKTLRIPPGTFSLSSLTFPAQVRVVLSRGALLDVDEDALIHFLGPFEAGLYTVFSDSGKVNFANAAVREVVPQWWVSPDGDDSIAIQRAVESGPSLPGIKVRLIGTFNCRSTIRINRHRAHLIGNGQYATQLLFDPPKDATLFEFHHEKREGVYKTGANLVVQCSIKDLSIMGARGNKHQKVAIKVVDADVLEVSGIAIQRWFGNGSIGLQLQGREFGFFENMSIRADLPISIEKDPYINWISIDMFTFRNMWLIVEDPNGPAVKIASGVAFHNLVFDGTHSWNGGKYGIYWKDTETKGVGINLTVKNVRMEQGKARGGHIIHIEHNFGLHNVVLENIYGCHGGPGGIYLRRCHNVSIRNVAFVSDKTDPAPHAIDIDESCTKVALVNTRWHTGAVKTGKLRTVFGSNTAPGAKNAILAMYDRPARHPIDEGVQINGTGTWHHRGKLAPGGKLTLPFSARTAVATIIVSASDGDAVHEAGQFMATHGKTVFVSGTNRLKTAATADSLCLVPGSSDQLINNLGTEVEVVVSVFGH
jgi:hypothetical protein